ncbi:MAG: 3-oxoacyl-ACP reductase FabG [Clostridia bacterium]|nr:3-oxoacyl-ACP reductase FabG [Clostridia bacterium]
MNKTVVITGAARGIGRQTAILFAQKGYNVAVNYFSNDAMANSLIDELKGMGCFAKAYKVDVADLSAVDAMIKLIIRDFGGISVVVNNAGVALYKVMTDVTDDEFDRLMNVNVKGVFNVSKAVLPHFINKKQGKIINVSSMWGVTGASCEVVYSASKAAVIGFTKALAKEVGPSNIQVNCVAPGVIQTDMTSNLDKTALDQLIDETPIMRLGTADDVAKSIAFLASDDADFITGQVINVNGGIVI